MITPVIMITMTVAIFGAIMMMCKISNICDDMKSATGSSQEAASVGFDFKIAT